MWFDQHPVFDTLIFGLFYRLGDRVGSPAFGVALYTTAITAAPIAVLVYIVRYLACSGDSRRTCLLVYGFFYSRSSRYMPWRWSKTQCSSPAFSCSPYNAWKRHAHVAQASQPQSSDPHQHTGAAGVAYQENWHLHGVIACILTMLVVAGRKVRLRLAGTVLASAIVMFLVLPGILFPLCHIEAGGKQEMIAVPLQQSALLLKEHGDELSQADRDVFEGILEPDAANKFFWLAVDPMKGMHWTAQRERLLKPFLRVWLRRGKVPHNVFACIFPAGTRVGRHAEPSGLRIDILRHAPCIRVHESCPPHRTWQIQDFPCQVTHCSTRGWIRASHG